MAHPLIWSIRAKADILKLAKYIEQDSKANADTMVGSIIEAVRRLPELPLSGRVVPEWNRAAFRELIVYPYRVVYTVSSGHVGIAMIRHSRQPLPKRPPRVRF
ncbi:MAG TPA: type II toxin-antitoxin system RelE/ParE family toxin [Longimicrobium sp.]|uniref:type II toxin-antitoxin system RelE/ParE family toxin n=1 Tax=Longimicrobium sp. TaxID=2029185 RepID=UPI002EDAA685